MSLLNNGILLEDFSNPEDDSFFQYPCCYPPYQRPGCYDPCGSKWGPCCYPPYQRPGCYDPCGSKWGPGFGFPCPPGYRPIKACVPFYPRPSWPCPPGTYPRKVCVPYRRYYPGQGWPC